MDHPPDGSLQRFVNGTASREESKATVAHLLKGCPACARKIRAFMQPEAVRRESYDLALERFDRGLVEALESSIPPVRTLRTVLSRLLDEDDPTPGPGKPPRRGS